MISCKNQKTFPKSKFTTGFTLVELLVSLTIFSIMTGVVLVNQEKFNNTILLTNLAHDVALTVRLAQTYGVNVRESSNEKFEAYGVSFSVSDNKNFVLFTDLEPVNPDGKFNGDFTCPSDDLECVEKYVIKRGSYIKSMCAGNNEVECVPVSNSMNITFKRPNQDAIIKTDLSSNNSYAQIIVSTPNGITKKVIIRSTGQIYVE